MLGIWNARWTWPHYIYFFKWNCKYAINCCSKEATCRIQNCFLQDSVDLLWGDIEAVVQNPQLKHDILVAGFLSIIFSKIHHFLLTIEFSFRKKAAHQLFSKKRQGGWEEGRGGKSLCIMMTFSRELQTESKDKYFKCDRFQPEMWTYFFLINSLPELVGIKFGLQLQAEAAVWRNKTKRHLSSNPNTPFLSQLAKYDWCFWLAARQILARISFSYIHIHSPRCLKLIMD